MGTKSWKKEDISVHQYVGVCLPWMRAKIRRGFLFHPALRDVKCQKQVEMFRRVSTPSAHSDPVGGVLLHQFIYTRSFVKAAV